MKYAVGSLFFVLQLQAQVCNKFSIPEIFCTKGSDESVYRPQKKDCLLLDYIAATHKDFWNSCIADAEKTVFRYPQSLRNFIAELYGYDVMPAIMQSPEIALFAELVTDSIDEKEQAEVGQMLQKLIEENLAEYLVVGVAKYKTSCRLLRRLLLGEVICTDAACHEKKVYIGHALLPDGKRLLKSVLTAAEDYPHANHCFVDMYLSDDE